MIVTVAATMIAVGYLLWCRWRPFNAGGELRIGARVINEIVRRSR